MKNWRRINFVAVSPSRWLFVFIAFISCAVPTTALGIGWLGWELDPAFSLHTEYSDNPVLQRGDFKQSGLITSPSIGLLLRRHEERWQADLGAQLDYIIFTGLEAIPNIDNQHLNLNSTFSLTKRSSFSLNGRLFRDNLVRQRLFLLGEEIFDPIDPAELEDIDIGLVGFTVRRNRLLLAPSWSYRLTERAALGVEYSFLDLSFGDPPDDMEVVTTPVPTEAHRVAATTSYELAAETILTAGVDALRTTSEDFQTDVLSFRAGVKYPFSELLTTNMEVGYRVSSTENGNREEKASGFVGQLGAQYETELSQFRGVITRMITPGGRGLANQTDRVVFHYDRSIRPRWAFSLKANGFIAEPIGVDTSKQIWLRSSAGLTWHWTRWWAVEGGYIYRRRSSGGASAESNGIFAAITYTPPPPGR